MFYASGSSESGTEILVEKKVDSKQELLDFRADELASNKPEVTSDALNRLNINSAKIVDLIKLPGVGETTAQRIIDYRQKIGKFKNINQLLRIKGIGSKKLEKIKSLIFIE